MDYAHLAPLANLMDLAGGQQMASFDSTSTMLQTTQKLPANISPDTSMNEYMSKTFIEDHSRNP